MTHLSFFWN